MRQLVMLVSLLIVLLVSACAAAPETSPVPATLQPAPSANPTSRPASQELTVFAAASLSEAFSELGKRFELANPGSRVTFNFSGSQQLAQQLAQGAQADVFASANQRQMDAAAQAGRIAAEQVRTLAGNQLIVIFAKYNPGNIRVLADLARPGVKLVLADQSVPAGQYALEFLEKASQSTGFDLAFKQAVLDNVVSYEENVRAVLTKVMLGEADAGIVYTSDVTPTTLSQIGVREIPPELNVNAIYYIAPVANSRQPNLAQAFIEYVLSSEGQDLLANYGLLPVQ